MNERYGYALYESSETWWTAEGDTREEAAQWVMDHKDVSVVWICERRTCNKLPLLLTVLDAERVLELAEESAGEDEECGWWDDSVFDSSKIGVERLDELLREAARTWLREYPGPHLWSPENVTRHERR